MSEIPARIGDELIAILERIADSLEVIANGPKPPPSTWGAFGDDEGIVKGL